MPIKPELQSPDARNHDREASATTGSPVLVDMMPVMQERRGVRPRRSGDRLAADLRTAREGVANLIGIIDNKLSGDETGQPELLRATLGRMLEELDGVNPHEPPLREALNLFSHRAKLIATAIGLLIQKRAADELLTQKSGSWDGSEQTAWNPSGSDIKGR